MKSYKRLTERITASNTERTVLVIPTFRHEIIEQTNRLAELEDKIENGELCDRKETTKEILLLLSKGFDETARKDFKDLQWYKQFCRELELKYGIELFGKTKQVGNSDKLEDEE